MSGRKVFPSVSVVYWKHHRLCRKNGVGHTLQIRSVCSKPACAGALTVVFPNAAGVVPSRMCQHCRVLLLPLLARGGIGKSLLLRGILSPGQREASERPGLCLWCWVVASWQSTVSVVYWSSPRAASARGWAGIQWLWGRLLPSSAAEGLRSQSRGAGQTSKNEAS